MKKHKNLNLVTDIVAVILVSVSLIILLMIFKMKIIPTKYLSIFLYTYIPLIIICLILLLTRKIKVKIKYAVIFLSSCIIALVSFISFNMFSTINFINNIKEKDYHFENYYLLVLKDSKYKSVDDLDNLVINTYNINNVDEEALKELNKKTNNKINNYTNFISLGQDLINNKIDAVFIRESYLSILSEDIENFSNNTKNLEKISMKVKNTVAKKEADIVKEPFNVYISGIDVYGSINTVSRSDVNMVASINPTTNKIVITSIPRDYYVQLSGTKGYRDKLTHAGLYGIDFSIKTIEELLDIKINYYIRVNFTTVVDLVNILGGITVDSDYTFTAKSGEKFKKGINKLNGDEALAFSRERYAFASGDRQRGKNQQKVIGGIIAKVSNSKTLLTKYTSILKQMKKSFQTNIDSDRIYQFVNMQLDKMPNWEVTNISLDGYDGLNYTYSFPKSNKTYVMEPDNATVEFASNAIKTIFEDQESKTDKKNN